MNSEYIGYVWVSLLKFVALEAFVDFYQQKSGFTLKTSIF